ncbi:sensor domain-containing protein [Chloroflexota bacterium]
MIQTIEQYLSLLKKELSGSDRATIQDALSDTEEHLRAALNTTIQAAPDVSEAESLESIIEKYGMPKEVAAAYKEIETLTLPTFSWEGHKRIELATQSEAVEHTRLDRRPFYKRFFGVVLEPRVWGAFFYLLSSLVTGIFYFTWVTTGMSLSLGLLILIIGLPFTGLFILSVRGLALVEGRIVEALLGVRMPRRPVFQERNRGWWQHFKDIVLDKHTWLSIIYMLLQLPLGIFYFTVLITLISVSLLGIAIPILQFGFDFPVAYINGISYYLSGWLMPLVVIAGVILGMATMHLSKVLGKAHGALARSLLVRI